MGKVLDFIEKATGPIGAAIGAVGTAIQNNKQRKFDAEQAQIQREWNEAMADKQNAWNYDMWLKENEYNTPLAQRERLKEAGLNPMYYGLDGNSSGAMQAAAQPLGYERASSSNWSNPFAVGSDAAVKAAQVQNIQANTQKVKSETKAIDSKLPFEVEGLRQQVRNSKLDADAKDIVNKYLDQQQQAELRVKTSTAAVNDKSVEKAFAEIEKMDYEKTTMFIGWLETNEKILNLQKQRELTDKQIEELGSLIRVNNATASKIGLDVRNYDDITVIGTASHSMNLGPFHISEGEPITLGMMKAAREHADELEKNKKKNKRSAEGSVSTADGSEYNGPIYD